ncbi:hypothetical protein, partial [Gordonibacter sp.]|uniref:hypothetical protein n=1 Tax=Gordonibacter sp. TaxID=1968902 RepID=UPI002FC8C2CC
MGGKSKILHSIDRFFNSGFEACRSWVVERITRERSIRAERAERIRAERAEHSGGAHSGGASWTDCLRAEQVELQSRPHPPRVRTSML